MDKSKFIIYIEISSLLHDIGKFSHEFILSKDPYSPIRDSHAFLILNEDFPKNLKKFLITPLNEIFGNFELVSDGVSPIHFICAHHGCERCKFRDKCKTFDKNPLIRLLKVGDRFDSSNPPNSGKQPFNKTFLSDFFLREKKVKWWYLTYLRKKLLRFIDPFFKDFNRDRIIWALKIFLSEGISDTRRGANDIDLFSHSYAVASIVKALLFDYLYFGHSFPETIFDVNLRFLKTDKIYKRKIEEELAFGNEIFEIDGKSFFLIGKGVDKLFIKIHGIKGEIVNEIFVKETDRFYPHPVKPSEILSTMLVKIPEDIGLSFEEMVEGVEKIVNFGRYKELERLKIIKKGIKKHIKNLMKGEKEGEIRVKRESLKRVENRIRYLKRLTKKPDIRGIENFLSLSLAPIRPPSINRFSSFLISLMKEKRMSIREITIKIFLNKPLTVSRVFRYGMDLKRVKSLKEIKKFYGKLLMGKKFLKGEYIKVKKVLKEEDGVKLIFDEFSLNIPLSYNGKELDKLNLYFFVKGKREENLSFYMGKGKSLVHITEIKEKDFVKILKQKRR